VNWIRRHLIISAIISIAVLVGLAILMQLTKSTNCLSNWVFTFLDDWAVILSALTALILVIVTIVNIIENRRRILLTEVQKWTRDALTFVSMTFNKEIPDIEIVNSLNSLLKEIITASLFASLVSGKIRIKVDVVRGKLTNFTDDSHKFINKKITESAYKSSRQELLDALNELLKYIS